MGFPNVKLIHPAFTQVSRRTTGFASPTATYLTGRWMAIDGSGNFAVPGTARDLANAFGLYWLLEGTHIHNGSNANFDAGTKDSTVSVALPSNSVNRTGTGAYGVFVGYVGPEGVDPAAAIVNGAELTVDQYGRLIVAGGGEVRVAIAEVVTTDGGGLTSVIFRTTGN